MPDFEFEITPTDEDPLWDANDPPCFVFIQPDGTRWRYVLANEFRAPDDRRVSMDANPISYMIEMIAGQVTLEKEAEVRRLSWELFEEQMLDQEKVKAMLEWATDQRKAARKALARRKTGRPTTAQSGSIS